MSDSGKWRAIKDRAIGIVRTIDGWLPHRLSRLARRFADSELLLSASSLAFYGLVSALPLLLIAFAFVEAVAGDDTLRSFADRVAEQGPEGSGQFLDQLIDGGGTFGFVTLLFTIWPATAYGGGLRRALSRHSEGSESAAGLRGRLLGLSMVLVLPVVVLGGIPNEVPAQHARGRRRRRDRVRVDARGGGGDARRDGADDGAVPRVLARIPRAAREPHGRVRHRRGDGRGLPRFVIYLGLGDTEERFGGGVIAVVVLLGLWLFVTNILLLAGYETVLELEDELEVR